MRKVKELRGATWKLQNSPGDAKYSIANIVNNSVSTTHGACGARLNEVTL